MTAMEEFRNKIRAKQMLEALTLAMSEAIELNITTWVASSEIDSAEESQPGYRLHTRINLVEGEVENEIGSEFLKNPAYSELQKLHLEQVRQSRTTLLKNINSLQKMFAVVSDTFPEPSQLSGDRPSPNDDT